MRLNWLFYQSLAILILCTACQKQAREGTILVLSSKRSDTTENIEVLRKFFESNNSRITSTSNPDYLQEDTLHKIDILIINHLDLEELNHFQINALERFLGAKGTCIGINLSASLASRYKSPRLYPHFYTDSLASTMDMKEKITKRPEENFFVFQKTPDTKQMNKVLEKVLIETRSKRRTGNFSQIGPDKLPPDYWFEIDTLSLSLNEPMELEVLPSGDVIYIERHGAINRYDAQSKEITVIGKLSTFASESNGLNGMALSPDYASTGFIYLSYLSQKDSTHQRISRFKILNELLDYNSEKIVMNIPIHKSDGWHGTNALEFDRHGNLYIALGDFTLQSNDMPDMPRSTNDREKARHDAQRTSASSNSYAGKILRIHPEPDGSYTVPEGNLS
ncbi:MAG: PQQ-dependent sugar dehydrogenase [Saprospiraceae bacterium]|nr:PQQ-dependent sugar dehydrogenase [Saprospiraceae bacterium]